MLFCEGQAELNAQLSVLFSQSAIDLDQRGGLFFAPEAAKAGTLAVLQQLVLGAREQLAHDLQVSDLHQFEVDAEGTDCELARIAVSRLLEAPACRKLILTLTNKLVFEFGQNILLTALTTWPDKSEARRQIGQDLSGLAQLGSLASGLLLGWHLGQGCS